MKKTYISPITKEVMINNHYSLLAGSLLNNQSEAYIPDDGSSIIDDSGTMDPEARVLNFEDDFEDEDLYDEE